MTFKNPLARLRSEPTLAYKAFLVYKDDRDLSSAYKTFMQQNQNALTTMNAFIKWASIWMWQKRLNEYDAQEELFVQQEARRLSRKNALTAETIAQELYISCMEEMNLRRSELTHRDIAKYMEICQKISDKWLKQPEAPVVVNVEQNVENVVKTETIDPAVAAAVGKMIALQESKEGEKKDE